jgi:hypothetical protein
MILDFTAEFNKQENMEAIKGYMIPFGEALAFTSRKSCILFDCGDTLLLLFHKHINPQ